MGKKSGSGLNKPGSYFRELGNNFFFFGLRFFDAVTGSGIEKISDPGWKKFGSGINILDPQHWMLIRIWACQSGADSHF
jgi:hypothetical protein